MNRTSFPLVSAGGEVLCAQARLETSCRRVKGTTPRRTSAHISIFFVIVAGAVPWNRIIGWLPEQHERKPSCSPRDQPYRRFEQEEAGKPGPPSDSGDPGLRHFPDNRNRPSRSLMPSRAERLLAVLRAVRNAVAFLLQTLDDTLDHQEGRAVDEDTDANFAFFPDKERVTPEGWRTLLHGGGGCTISGGCQLPVIYAGRCAAHPPPRGRDFCRNCGSRRHPPRHFPRPNCEGHEWVSASGYASALRDWESYLLTLRAEVAWEPVPPDSPAPSIHWSDRE